MSVHSEESRIVHRPALRIHYPGTPREFGAIKNLLLPTRESPLETRATPQTHATRTDDGWHGIQRVIAGHAATYRSRWPQSAKENTMSASHDPTRVDFPSGGLTVAAYRWDPDGAPRAIVQINDPRCGFGPDTAAAKAMFAAARQMADRDRVAGMRSDLPIYIATGEMDPVNGQLALVNALVDRCTSAGLTDVTLKMYPQARHEIFNETNRDEVVDDLLTWLDQKLSP